MPVVTLSLLHQSLTLPLCVGCVGTCYPFVTTSLLSTSLDIVRSEYLLLLSLVPWSTRCVFCSLIRSAGSMTAMSMRCGTEATLSV